MFLPRLAALTRPRALAISGVAVLGLVFSWRLLGPTFSDREAWGVHDWDVATAYRAMPLVSLRTYHEGPWWSPWFCGGFPGWAYAEGATSVVSPFLPFYLLLPVNLAVRVEVLASTLLAMVGAGLLARRFTSHPALWGFVALAWTLCGRWAMQLSAGHSWHLTYAWLPFSLVCFDLALESRRPRFAVAAGGVLALLVYLGGIYPLPHAALALGLWACLAAIHRRALAPLGQLALTAATALGLSAPKLFPLLELASRSPRLIDSTEAVELPQLWFFLTDRAQGFGAHPFPVPSWGWHEYGHYLGLLPVCLTLATLPFARGPRELALRLVGLLFVVLSLGAFAPWAPWTWLHRLPLFASQHVPSRFLFPGMLLLLVAAAGSLGRLVDRLRWPWLEVALLVPLVGLGLDLTQLGREWTERAFTLHAPRLEADPVFHHHQHSPARYSGALARGTVASMMPALEANSGVLACYGATGTNEGAQAVEDEGFEGEVFVSGGQGEARLVSWTPSTATVTYTGASPGAALVYNMNFDPSWRADGAPAIALAGAVAVPLTAASGTVRFSYFPRTLPAGLAVFAASCLALLIGWRRLRAPGPGPAAATPTSSAEGGA